MACTKDNENFPIPIYNEEYDCDVLRSDVIRIIPDKVYKFIITLETTNGEYKLIPTITLPEKKGYMKTKQADGLYMLSPMLSSTHSVCEIELLSELGCIDISYHCEAYDHRNKAFWGSSKLFRPLGMKKEIVSPNKVRYYCTDLHSDSFEQMVFTTEWMEIYSKAKEIR
ncbi:MAG: hypothetical protein ACI3YE_00655 [Candidatus Avispirillum sp.]